MVNEQEIYDGVTADHIAGNPSAEASRMFGSPVLKVSGKTFAMLVKGRPVVKVPRARAAQLVEQGDAAFFDPGHGRPMKEWVSLIDSEPETLAMLLREAHEHVAVEQIRKKQ